MHRFDLLDYVLVYVFSLDLALSVVMACEGADYLRGLWPATPGEAAFSAYMHMFNMIASVISYTAQNALSTIKCTLTYQP